MSLQKYILTSVVAAIVLFIVTVLIIEYAPYHIQMICGWVALGIVGVAYIIPLILLAYVMAQRISEQYYSAK